MSSQPDSRSPSPPAPKRRGAVWLRLFGTLLAVALLVWLLSRQGWGEIAASFQQIALWRILAALGLTLGSRLAVSARWFVLLRAADVNTTFGQAARITFAGLFASNFLPTTVGGDVVRLGGGLHYGFDRAITLLSLVVDRLVGMVGFAAAVPFGLPAFWGYLSGARPGVGIVPMLLAASTATRLRPRLARWLDRLRQTLALWLHRPSSLLLALGCSWARMACDFLTVAVLLEGMGESLSFWLIAGLSSIAYFITLLPVSINGLGLQEVSVTLLYANIGGISGAAAGALALFIRLLPLLVSLPGALFVPGMLMGDGRPATADR